MTHERGQALKDANPSSRCGPCLASAVRERVRVAGIAQRRALSAAARLPCVPSRLPAGRRALAAPGAGSIVQLARNARACAPACAMASAQVVVWQRSKDTCTRERRGC